MADIFISYAHEDRTIAGELVRSFEGRGWSVWWDRDVPPGREFESTIENALLAAGCVIVLWSRYSIKSRWVRNEAREAAELGRFIPVVLDDCRIPFAFRGFESIALLDWPSQTTEAEQQKLVRTIAAMLARDPDNSITSAARVRDDPTLSVRIANRVAARLDSASTQAATRLSFETLLADIAIKAAAGSSSDMLVDNIVEGLAEVFAADYAGIADTAARSAVLAEIYTSELARSDLESRLTGAEEEPLTCLSSIEKEGGDLWALKISSEVGYHFQLYSRAEYPNPEIETRIPQLKRLLDICWSLPAQ